MKRKYDDENDDLYIYDIVGIVIHQGTANRGHYYSYIKDRNAFINSSNRREQWYEFNDKKVSKKDYGSIEKEAFGGASNVLLNENDSSNNNRSRNNNPWNKKNLKKSKQESVEILSDRNAYILFYEQRAVKKEQKMRMKQQKQNGAMNLNEINM